MLLFPFQKSTSAAGQAYTLVITGLQWKLPSRVTEFSFEQQISELQSHVTDDLSKDTHTYKSFFSKNILIFLTNEETFSHAGQQKGDTETIIIHSQILPQEHSNFAYICLKNKQP